MTPECFWRRAGSSSRLYWATACLAILLCGPAVGRCFIVPPRNLKSFSGDYPFLLSGRGSCSAHPVVGRQRHDWPNVAQHQSLSAAIHRARSSRLPERKYRSCGLTLLHATVDPNFWADGGDSTSLWGDTTQDSEPLEATELQAKKRDYSWGTRKRSYARVRLPPGTGKLTINDRDAADYLQDNPWWIHNCVAPLMELQMESQFDIIAQAHGGGLGGQSGAIMLAVAREIVRQRPELRSPLRRAGFLTVDARKVERKKFGLRKARKKEQYSKR
ncbi:ribosomal protein RPS9 [Besnoitia besnoiti]|uniref:Ribosomal protein RPS9 n=1 Tax=Besnoitia besnoiti TaxID=94643 RepID=A0A2A9MJY9_BESBE|nr:ribosomal protein RPS9 [Besnoitia besnoiti]PFH37504.1 ribosomal protein RPS9 [Besnoitia besnoiti]